MAEFPNVGQHCGAELCNRLDFLPIKCDACSGAFCTDHFTYEAHGCFNSFKKNAQVPICPVCSQPVPTPKGLSVDYQVNEHIQNNCAVNKKAPIFKNKCTHPGCKKKELVPIKCTSCSLNFCLGHRHERDHNCKGPEQAPPRGGIFNSAMSVLNRNQRGQNCASQARTSQESNDEALARALQQEEYNNTETQRTRSRSDNSNCSVS